MKKKFIEPELVRIDLKMTENIAISDDGVRYYPIISPNNFENMFATKQGISGYCTRYVADSHVSLDEFHVHPEDYVMDLKIVTTCPVVILQSQGKI